jgi:hypothetical protein
MTLWVLALVVECHAPHIPIKIALAHEVSLVVVEWPKDVGNVPAEQDGNSVSRHHASWPKIELS